METIQKLIEVFSDNFVNNYRAHSAHFNIVGQNFYGWHKLLQKIYEDSEAIQDDLGELIRALSAYAPETIGDILAGADLADTIAPTSDAMALLELVLEGQEHMVESYRKLEEIAEIVFREWGVSNAGICIEFVDESAFTLFMLKWGD